MNCWGAGRHNSVQSSPGSWCSAPQGRSTEQSLTAWRMGPPDWVASAADAGFHPTEAYGARGPGEGFEAFV